MVQALDLTDRIALQPQTLQARVVLEVLDFRKSLKVEVQNVVEGWRCVELVTFALIQNRLFGHPSIFAVRHFAKRLLLIATESRAQNERKIRQQNHELKSTNRFLK